MPGVPKNVLLQLAVMADEHGYAWPSIKTLSMWTDWSRSSVIDALNFLEVNNVIRREKSSGRHTAYWVNPANWQGERHPIREADQSISRTGPPDRRVGIVDPTRPQSGRDPSTTRTPIPLNISESNTPQPPDRGRSSFDEFFEIFPKRVDEDKARKQWEQLAPDDELCAVILASVLEWRRSEQWKQSDGSFIPKPHNWLRNEGWRNIPGITPLPPKAVPIEQPKSSPAKIPPSALKLAAGLLGSKARSQSVREFALNTKRANDGGM